MTRRPRQPAPAALRRGVLDTVIEILLLPFLPLAYLVWLAWRRHERAVLGWTDCADEDLPMYGKDVN